ncbi:MAG: hypothetical protein ACKO96_19310 [Flammeovirgaceae bacterium]
MKNDPKMQALIEEIGLETFRFYTKVAKGAHPDFNKAAARFIPSYFNSREESGL